MLAGCNADDMHAVGAVALNVDQGSLIVNGGVDDDAAVFLRNIKMTEPFALVLVSVTVTG